MNEKIITISVVVCTHNREKMLEATLVSLLHQDFDPTKFEIIVVDNASNDGSRDLISSYSETTQSPRIRYIYEEHLGSSWARNAGWKAVDGGYIAFIDDDEKANQDWLQSLVSTLEEYSPLVTAVGGAIQLDWSGQRPKWLPCSMEGLYSGVDFGSLTRYLTSSEYPYTSNLALQRSLFTEIGGFNTNLGHVGANPIGGEDVELVDRVRSSGKQIIYEPKAIVHHYIPKSRQTRRWLFKRCFFWGVSTPILDNVHQVRGKDVFYNLRQAILFSLKAIIFQIRRRTPDAVENGCQSAKRLGRAIQLFRMIGKNS